MIGQNFLPSLNDDEQRKKRAQAGGPVQEAIKILSLSIPRVQGAQGVVPMALLSGGGMPDGGLADPVVEQVLRQMLGQFKAAGTPSVTPGIQPNPMPPPQNTPMPKVDFAPTPQPQRPQPRDPFSGPRNPRKF